MQSQVLPRRRAHVRHGTSERVRIARATADRADLDGSLEGWASAEPLDGWALNVSRGGVRVLVLAPLRLGERVFVSFGLSSNDSENRTSAESLSAGMLEPFHHHGRVVWLQEEADGVIAGIEFLAASGVLRAAPRRASIPDE